MVVDTCCKEKDKWTSIEILQGTFVLTPVDLRYHYQESLKEKSGENERLQGTFVDPHY